MDTPPIIEKELQRKPPRRVVNRNGKWGDIAPWAFLLLPHFWIAVVVPFVWLAFVVTTFCAEPMPARVTHHQLGQSKNRTTYTVSYEIDSNNTIIKRRTSVDRDRYESLKDGDALTVYALRSLPWFAPRLDHNPSALLPVLAFLTCWSIIWCGVTFGIVWAMLDQPLRSQRLTKYGTALLATITEVQTTKGRNRNYQLFYEYEAKKIDKQTNKKVTAKFNGKMSIKSSDVSAAEDLKGHQVTVLIDDKKPQKSILYRFGAHKAVG